MPDGSVVDYLLEPTGVGGGRLRGRDRAADIERTLPLSSVRGHPAPTLLREPARRGRSDRMHGFRA